MNFEWSFNLKVYIGAYRDLGYQSDPGDWNVRFNSAGEIRLDNTGTRSTTTLSIEDSILTVTVSPWNTEIADPQTQNLDLLQSNFNWRDSELYPVPNPSPEGVAFVEHLKNMGYYPLRIEGEYEEETYGED